MHEYVQLGAKLFLIISKFWRRMVIGKPALNCKVVRYHILLPSICQYVQEIEILNLINSLVPALFELFKPIIIKNSIIKD